MSFPLGRYSGACLAATASVASGIATSSSPTGLHRADEFLDLDFYDEDDLAAAEALVESETGSRITNPDAAARESWFSSSPTRGFLQKLGTKALAAPPQSPLTQDNQREKANKLEKFKAAKAHADTIYKQTIDTKTRLEKLRKQVLDAEAAHVEATSVYDKAAAIADTKKTAFELTKGHPEKCKMQADKNDNTAWGWWQYGALFSMVKCESASATAPEQEAYFQVVAGSHLKSGVKALLEKAPQALQAGAIATATLAYPLAFFAGTVLSGFLPVISVGLSFFMLAVKDKSFARMEVREWSGQPPEPIANGNPAPASNPPPGAKPRQSEVTNSHAVIVGDTTRLHRLAWWVYRRPPEGTKGKDRLLRTRPVFRMPTCHGLDDLQNIHGVTGGKDQIGKELEHEWGKLSDHAKENCADFNTVEEDFARERGLTTRRGNSDCTKNPRRVTGTELCNQMYAIRMQNPKFKPKDGLLISTDTREVDDYGNPRHTLYYPWLYVEKDLLRPRYTVKVVRGWGVRVVEAARFKVGISRWKKNNEKPPKALLIDKVLFNEDAEMEMEEELRAKEDGWGPMDEFTEQMTVTRQIPDWTDKANPDQPKAKYDGETQPEKLCRTTHTFANAYDYVTTANQYDYTMNTQPVANYPNMHTETAQELLNRKPKGALHNGAARAAEKRKALWLLLRGPAFAGALNLQKEKESDPLLCLVLSTINARIAKRRSALTRVASLGKMAGKNIADGVGYALPWMSPVMRGIKGAAGAVGGVAQSAVLSLANLATGRHWSGRNWGELDPPEKEDDEEFAALALLGESDDEESDIESDDDEDGPKKSSFSFLEEEEESSFLDHRPSVPVRPAADAKGGRGEPSFQMNGARGTIQDEVVVDANGQQSKVTAAATAAVSAQGKARSHEPAGAFVV